MGDTRNSCRHIGHATRKKHTLKTKGNKKTKQNIRQRLQCQPIDCLFLFNPGTRRNVIPTSKAPCYLKYLRPDSSLTCGWRGGRLAMPFKEKQKTESRADFLARAKSRGNLYSVISLALDALGFGEAFLAFLNEEVEARHPLKWQQLLRGKYPRANQSYCTVLIIICRLRAVFQLMNPTDGLFNPCTQTNLQ